MDILKPGYRKLKQKTGKPVFGTIPLVRLFDYRRKIPSAAVLIQNRLRWNKQNLKKD